MSKKVRELIKLLEMNGWHFIRERGDHKIYGKEGAKRSIPVPGKMSKDLRASEWYGILREAGIDW